MGEEWGRKGERGNRVGKRDNRGGKQTNKRTFDFFSSTNSWWRSVHSQTFLSTPTADLFGQPTCQQTQGSEIHPAHGWFTLSTLYFCPSEGRRDDRDASQGAEGGGGWRVADGGHVPADPLTHWGHSLEQMIASSCSRH